MAVYAARFGHLARWPLESLLFELAGRPVDLEWARTEFARVLRVDLPSYWAVPTRS